MKKSESDSYVVLASGLTGSNGELFMRGMVLTGEQVGDTARRLGDGSIRHATAEEEDLTKVDLEDTASAHARSLQDQLAAANTEKAELSREVERLRVENANLTAKVSSRSKGKSEPESVKPPDGKAAK